jgi:hypothetical protein
MVVTISAPFLCISIFFDLPPAGLEMRLDNDATHLVDRHSDNAAYLADAQSECKECADAQSKRKEAAKCARPFQGGASPAPTIHGLGKPIRCMIGGLARPCALRTPNML